MFDFFSGDKVKGSRNENLPLPNDGLPDSFRPSGLCPRCNKQSSFECIGSLPVTFDGGFSIHNKGQREPSHSDRVSCFVCRHCNQGVVVIEEQWVGDMPTRLVMKSGVVTFRGIHWWPLPESNLSSDIPLEIANVFSEATTTLMSNCPRASVVMSRRTLECITENFGEVKGTLAQRLSALSTKGTLHPTLSEWAKEVRLVGNTGAHYDPKTHVTIEDAKQLLEFVREILKYLYELPADLDRRKNPKP